MKKWLVYDFERWGRSETRENHSDAFDVSLDLSSSQEWHELWAEIEMSEWMPSWKNVSKPLEME